MFAFENILTDYVDIVLFEVHMKLLEQSLLSPFPSDLIKNWLAVFMYSEILPKIILLPESISKESFKTV